MLSLTPIHSSQLTTDRRQTRIETKRVDQGQLALHDPLGLDTVLAATRLDVEPSVNAERFGTTPPGPTRPGLAFWLYQAVSA